MAGLLVYNPKDFADSTFAQEFSECFDRFIELRIHGLPRDIAIIESFDLIANGVCIKNSAQLGLAAECNPYVKLQFPKMFAEKQICELWDEKKSISHLLRIVENEHVRESVRILAIKELNTLYNITYVDERGNTRAVRTLDDFYKSVAQHKRHPDPRSPEAEAYLEEITRH